MKWFEVAVLADGQVVDRVQVYCHNQSDAEHLALETARDGDCLPEVYDDLTYQVEVIDSKPDP